MLETEEIVASDSYLRFNLSLRSRGPVDTRVPGLDPFSQSLLDRAAEPVQLVALKDSLARNRTAWLVCETCLDAYFR